LFSNLLQIADVSLREKIEKLQGRYGVEMMGKKRVTKGSKKMEHLANSKSDE
jgi:hypothetical protein